MKFDFLTPDFVRASTPSFLGALGAGIAIAVIATPNLNDAKWTAALGLAGNAFAGAAGIAQSTKNDSGTSGKSDSQSLGRGVSGRTAD